MNGVFRSISHHENRTPKLTRHRRFPPIDLRLSTFSLRSGLMVLCPNHRGNPFRKKIKCVQNHLCPNHLIFCHVVDIHFRSRWRPPRRTDHGFRLDYGATCKKFPFKKVSLRSILQIVVHQETATPLVFLPIYDCFYCEKETQIHYFPTDFPKNRLECYSEADTKMFVHRTLLHQ